MRRYTDHQILRLGAVAIAVLLLAMAASFNLSKFPGFAGETYRAEFSDASGLRKGNMVQVAGMRSGRVTDLSLDGNKVVVTFEVDREVEFGTGSEASVEVLNLLGEKYLELTPVGPGQLEAGGTIPLERTKSAYDIVGVLGDLTGTTERIKTGQLKQALNTVARTLNSSAPEIQSSFRGISRLSQTIASRDAELKTLLRSSHTVSKILADRSTDIVKLMESGDLVLRELRARKDAVHRLLVNARSMARQLRGLAEDNQSQIDEALSRVEDLSDLLLSKEKELGDTIRALGPYATILGNIIGTGPWFDAYVVNLAAIPTGEFQPTGGTP